MPNSRSSLLSLFLPLLIPVACFAAGAEIQLRSLSLEGVPAASQVWLFETYAADRPDSAYTLLWRRTEGSSAWNYQPPIPFGVRQATHLGTDPVLLLNDGQWIILGRQAGPSLPGYGRIASLAGNDASLWAIGEIRLPATQPTTRFATQPATTQAVEATPAPLGLFEYVGNTWQPHGALPTALAQNHPTLGIVRGRPMIATAVDHTLRLWQLGTDNTWIPAGEHDLAPGLLPARVLDENSRAVIYLTGNPGPAEVLVLGTNWLPAAPLSGGASIRTFGIAGEMFRYVYADKGEIKERRISPRTLQDDGSDQTIVLPQIVDLSQVYTGIQFFDMALIVLIMVHTYRKREEYQQAKIDWGKYQICPIGRRVFAAMIDFIPVLGMLVYIRFHVDRVETITDVFLNRDAFILYTTSVIAYLAHTTLVECVMGRSLGKIIGRMHVVTLDGKTPTRKALLIRNLLRIIDVTLLFTPLLALYLPLRQRLGDLGAGTIVTAEREDNTGPDA